MAARYRRRVKATNLQKRLIQEVRRRKRVIRIFPNENSALRSMGALLAEIHEEWQQRRLQAVFLGPGLDEPASGKVIGKIDPNVSIVMLDARQETA